MDYLCLTTSFGATFAVFAVFSVISFFITAVMLAVSAIIRRNKRKKTLKKEESAFKAIEAGIRSQLHAAYPDSKWRWLCHPMDFALNGGIARIDVIKSCGGQLFIDVCLSASKHMMVLHISNAALLTSEDKTTSEDEAEEDTAVMEAGDKKDIPISPLISPPIPPATMEIKPITAEIKPDNEESLTKWYNIVLIDSLTDLIGELNAVGEVCLYINQEGKAYIEENSIISIVYDFGEMPDTALWGCIIDKLGNADLFAEIQEENRIFISWA